MLSLVDRLADSLADLSALMLLLWDLLVESLVLRELLLLSSVDLDPEMDSEMEPLSLMTVDSLAD